MTVSDSGSAPKYGIVVTAELDCYLIPISNVAGLQCIQLSGYEQFRVGRFGNVDWQSKVRAQS